MVIGVEGNVHVGKTTFINNNFSKFIIIKETKFKQDLNDYDRQLYYIKSEIEKKKNLGVNTIIDRTIISTIIYTIYTETLSSTEKNKIINIINYNSFTRGLKLSIAATNLGCLITKCIVGLEFFEIMTWLFFKIVIVIFLKVLSFSVKTL